MWLVFEMSILAVVGDSKVKTGKERVDVKWPGDYHGNRPECNSISDDHSLCRTTMTPMSPNNTVFNQGCSDSNIVTYPTNGT